MEGHLNNPAVLSRIESMIDTEKWVSMSSDVKGEIYEGLLQKNAEDVKSGAGQYFTPRPLIKAMVKCIRPEPMKTVIDPCCGSGGFLLSAQDFIAENYTLDREQKEFLKSEAFHGNEIVANTLKKNHGSADVREYYQTNSIGWLSNKEKWKGIKCIGMVIRTHNGISERRYYISSLNCDIKLFSRAVKGHWSVESMH